MEDQTPPIAETVPPILTPGKLVTVISNNRHPRGQQAKPYAAYIGQTLDKVVQWIIEEPISPRLFSANKSLK